MREETRACMKTVRKKDTAPELLVQRVTGELRMRTGGGDNAGIKRGTALTSPTEARLGRDRYLGMRDEG